MSSSIFNTTLFNANTFDGGDATATSLGVVTVARPRPRPHGLRPGHAVVVSMAALALAAVPLPKPHSPVIARRTPVPVRGGSVSITGLRAAPLAPPSRIAPPQLTLARPPHGPSRPGRTLVVRGVRIEVPLTPVASPIVVRRTPQPARGGSVAITGLRAAAPPAVAPTSAPPLIARPEHAPPRPGRAWVSPALGAVQAVPDTERPTVIVAQRSLRPARGGSVAVGLSAALFSAPAPVPTTPALPSLARPAFVSPRNGTAWVVSNLGATLLAPPEVPPAPLVVRRTREQLRRGSAYAVSSLHAAVTTPLAGTPPRPEIARRYAGLPRRGHVWMVRPQVTLPAAPVTAQPTILIAGRTAAPPRRGHALVVKPRVASFAVPAVPQQTVFVARRTVTLQRHGYVLAVRPQTPIVFTATMQPTIIVASRTAVLPRRGHTTIVLHLVRPSVVPVLAYPTAPILVRRYAPVRGGQVLAPAVQLSAASEASGPPQPPPPPPAIAPDLMAAVVTQLRQDGALMTALGEDTSSPITTKIWADDQAFGQPSVPFLTYSEPTEDVQGTTGRIYVVRGMFTISVHDRSKLASRNLGGLVKGALDNAPLVILNGEVLFLRHNTERFQPVTSIAPGFPAFYKMQIDFDYLISMNFA